MPRTLYICYFGLREPLVQTQVLPYLRELRKMGREGRGDTGTRGHGEQNVAPAAPSAENHPVGETPPPFLRKEGSQDAASPPAGGELWVTLLTFEPEFRKNWTAEEIEAERKRLAAEGIEWHATGYHKWPSVPATFFDILNGTRIVWSLMRRQKYDILHGRVHIPTLMGALARKFSRRRPKLLFDIRGFFPEEYSDAGRWPEGGWLYRAAKRVERWLLKESDGFVVLTEKAREILFPESKETGFDRLGRPVEVIPCCVDLERFRHTLSRDEARARLGVENRFVVAYVGSFGGWYMTDEMTDFFETARDFRPDTFILILTQREKEKVADALRQRRFADTDFLVASVRPDEIADYLTAGDVAVSFIKACYSKQSSSPTKIAEYLACGLPVIANSGVGDLDALIAGNTGVLVRDFSRESFRRALAQVSKFGSLNGQCRTAAAEGFDLESVGGGRYRKLYGALLSK